ncbi:MAG: hypothetical protein ACLFV3_09400 [Phycisphaeraceae bacterium]
MAGYVMDMVSDNLPLSLLAAVGLVLLIVAGLLLWLLGRKLARPACVVSGLVLGSLAGWFTAEAAAPEALLPLVIGLGVAGALLAALLFRVWIALSAAGLLALAVPAAVLLWQGTPLPAATAETETATEAPAVAPGPEASGEDEPAEGDAGDAERSAISEQVDEAARRAGEAARGWVGRQVEAVSAWWAELEGPVKQRIYLAAGFGAVAGLVLGLLAPLITASVESALVGSILVLLPTGRLITDYAPDFAGAVPQTPRMFLLWLGLITVVGILIQWTLFREKAD